MVSRTVTSVRAPPHVQFNEMKSKIKEEDKVIIMQNKTIIVAAAAVIIAAVAIAAGSVLMDSGSEYEKVRDTGEIIGVGTTLVYDAEVVLDGEKKTGEFTMKILGINPSGALISMEASESIGTGMNSGVILTNDMAGSDIDVKVQKDWEEIDTNFGKKRMSYTESIEEGMTTKAWTDQFTGIDYKEVLESDTMTATLTLKSMDVVWMSSTEDIPPSEDLGKTRNYVMTMMDTEVGEMTMTIVTNPDKDGIYYTRTMMVVDGQVAGLSYSPSGKETEGATPTGRIVAIGTVDGEKLLTEYSMEMDGAAALAYIEDGKIYRMVIDTGYVQATLDYTGETMDVFWEEEEE